jgi:hypothetical protein
MELSEKERITLEKYSKFLYEQNPSSSFLVQIIELTGRQLNLETISGYAKRTGKSYNGVKNHRTIKKLFNVKFVIEND